MYHLSSILDSLQHHNPYATKMAVPKQNSFQLSSPKRNYNPIEANVIKIPLLLLMVTALLFMSPQKTSLPFEQPNNHDFDELDRESRRAQLPLGTFTLPDRLTANPSEMFRIPDIDREFDPSLDQMWQCKNEDRSSKKLVFVHVFKTAGSTIRSVLQAYSHQCNAGLAIVVSCTSLSLESLGMRTVWKNGKGKREGNLCSLKKAFGRGQDTLPIPSDKSINTSYIEQHVDILAGHLPMGSDYGWKNNEGTQVEVMNLVFLRDATRKYVSGILFKNPTLTLDKAVRKIKDFVTKERKASKYYEKYSSYLITPEQKYQLISKGVVLNREQRVNLTMINLLEANVLVGIVERMPESLELMKHTMDRNHELKNMFEFFGMRDEHGNVQKQEKNKSTLSSSDVLAELRKDAAFFAIFEEYVKYDDKIYNFGLELHKRQYEAMQLAQQNFTSLE
jgi:hypothetical protein